MYQFYHVFILMSSAFVPFTPCSYGCPSFPILRLHSYPRYYELYAFAGLTSIITSLTLVPAVIEGREFFRANPRLESKFSSWLTETFIRLVVTSQHGPVSVCNECKLQLGSIIFLIIFYCISYQNYTLLYIFFLNYISELEEVKTIATEINTEFDNFERNKPYVSSRGIYMSTPFTTLSLVYHPIIHITVVCGVGV